MELRHLRYFIAVAEAGSLTVAAAQTLHTSQPSLSRQINDLESEIGTPLFKRSTRGTELTAAGRVFLDQARLILSQVESAIEAARRLAETTRPHFVLGFLSGHESTWLPAALRILHDELPNLHVVVSSQTSPQLAIALTKGTIDAAFVRREYDTADLAFQVVAEETLQLFMPRDHRLAAKSSIDPQEIRREALISVSGRALGGPTHPPALRLAIDAYLEGCGLHIKPSHEVDNLAGVMSLIVSTRGVALLPTYAKHLLLEAVISRPLQGASPTIDLCLGYRKNNTSPALKAFLSRFDELVAGVEKQPG